MGLHHKPRGAERREQQARKDAQRPFRDRQAGEPFAHGLAERKAGGLRHADGQRQPEGARAASASPMPAPSMSTEREKPSSSASPRSIEPELSRSPADGSRTTKIVSPSAWNRFCSGGFSGAGEASRAGSRERTAAPAPSRIRMPAPIQRPALGGRNAPSAPPAVTAAKAKPVESSAIAVLAAAPILTPRRPKEAPAANRRRSGRAP